MTALQVEQICNIGVVVVVVGCVGGAGVAGGGVGCCWGVRALLQKLRVLL